jgi:hypothetical protein
MTSRSHKGTKWLRRILVVLPAATILSTQEGNGHRTGYFMSELIVPLTKLVSVGIEPIFATPNGAIPKVDPISDDPKWFNFSADYRAAKKLLGDLKGLTHPRALESLSFLTKFSRMTKLKLL